jgi:hypothetical protein
MMIRVLKNSSRTQTHGGWDCIVREGSLDDFEAQLKDPDTWWVGNAWWVGLHGE